MRNLRQGGIAIIDYGSQYTQLIARRIRFPARISTCWE